MQAVRRVDPGEAVALIVELPWARRGYDELASFYEAGGMSEEAGVMKLIVSERFGADHPGSDPEQRGDHREVP